MYKMDLEKAEEDQKEIKLPHMLDYRKSKRISGKFCFTDYTKAFDCVDHNKLWKIIQEMGISDHLTCLLRNLYVGEELDMKQQTGSK